MNTNLRWKQRLDNYHYALIQLQHVIKLARSRPLTDLEKQGLIQAFEFTHELSWNVMKDYFVYQDNSEITGSRDVVHEAFSKGLLDDGEGWMAMIKSRNLSSHAYNQKIADEIIEKILSCYGTLFDSFFDKMSRLKHD